MSDSNVAGMVEGGDAGIHGRCFEKKSEKAFTILTVFLIGG
ncbi:MAG: hypothetical protein V2I56_01525 [Desulfobacteraceae bacterium]|jgi:hypothetical protein|nr:hypothetical protein [Desulfobacteraceae bacterium]